jgi:circadian clock protein KaiB
MQSRKSSGNAAEHGEQAREDGTYVLQLFIAGMNPKSMNAVRSINAFCEKHLPGRYEIEVVDIYQHPEKAREENLVVAPTLIKQLPPPLMKFIGDLSSEDVLLKGIGLKSR